MRVLVTGAGGQVGHEVVAAFEASGHEVIAAGRRALDIADRDAVLGALSTLAPTAVVNTAAWTAVDACEADPDRAFAVNALGVRHLAEGARLTGAHLCHLSTDYVFSGTKDGPYHEWDDPDPRSVYGRSKLAGEAELGPGATVVRTSWVCGRVGSNMAKTVLRLAAERHEMAFVDDQRGCPTVASDLAATVRTLVVGRRPGVFHVTNQGATTWYGFARAVMAAAGHDADRVRAITTAELDSPRPARRPANSTLDNLALRLGGLPLLPPWRESLDRLVHELVER
jgi:dTDP-4-dehydrorhamnose reductase